MSDDDAPRELARLLISLMPLAAGPSPKAAPVLWLRTPAAGRPAATRAELSVVSSHTPQSR